MKKNLIKEEEKLHNKNDKDSSEDSEELFDQPKELDFISKFKRKQAMFVTYRGFIQTGFINFADSLTLMYKTVANQNWKLSNGQTTGISQNASFSSGKIIWNFPFQQTYETKNPTGWPQILIILYGKDYFGRSVAKGYGNIHLPSAQGNHTRKIKIFETIPPSTTATCCAFIMGYMNELKQPEKALLGEQQCRQNLRVRSMGQIIIKLEVRRYNFQTYGYE